MWMVKGGNQQAARLCNKVLAQHLTFGVRGIVGDYPCCIALGACELRDRRIFRHDDCGFDIQKISREGNCLGMVTRGVGDDPRTAIAFV